MAVGCKRRRPAPQAPQMEMPKRHVIGECWYPGPALFTRLARHFDLRQQMTTNMKLHSYTRVNRVWGVRCLDIMESGGRTIHAEPKLN